MSFDEFQKFGELLIKGKNLDLDAQKIIGYEKEQKLLKNFFYAVKNFKEWKQRVGLIHIQLTALLIGPPGVGKTVVVKKSSEESEVPLFLVYADNLVTQYLGKTLENIRTMLKLAENYARTTGPIIVFLDELDALGSERGNINEVGEIKRAVVTLLQHLDRIISLNLPIGFIGATNHEDMLDSAIWRRFSLHLHFSLPDYNQRKAIIEYYIGLLPDNQNIDLDQLALDEITGGFSGADIERGFQIALFQSVENNFLTTDVLAGALMLAGGTATHLKQSKKLMGDDIEKDDEMTLKRTFSSSSKFNEARK